MPMDVLFDARVLNRSLSGLERVQLNVIRELAAIPEITRLRVVLLRGTEPAKPLPVAVERCEVETTEDILRLLLDPEDRPDVYHLSWFPDATPRDLWLPLAAPASVVEVHDAILNRHPEYFPDRSAWSWYDGFTRQLIRNADRLLVHTRSVVGEIERDLDGGTQNVDLAPLAVDPDFLVPLPQAEVVRRCKAIGFPGPFVLAVGKDYPHKDHATLFRAVARLDPSVHLCVAGTKIWRHAGETSDEVIAGLGIGSRVRWVEGLDDLDVQALIQGARAMAFPSLEEGFGLPPIEAMALGTPVVAADAMSIPEVCGDGAWLHQPGDDAGLEALLRRVLAGGPEVEALIGRGRDRARSFSWHQTAAATVASYRRAIETAADGTSPRPELPPAVVANLRNMAAFRPVARAAGSEAEAELHAWRRRCTAAEGQLRRARLHGQSLERLLLAADGTLPPRPEEPALPPAYEPRPRWSLRRRMLKIQSGLRSRFRS